MRYLSYQSGSQVQTMLRRATETAATNPMCALVRPGMRRRTIVTERSDFRPRPGMPGFVLMTRGMPFLPNEPTGGPGKMGQHYVGWLTQLSGQDASSVGWAPPTN